MGHRMNWLTRKSDKFLGIVLLVVIFAVWVVTCTLAETFIQWLS